MKVASEHQEQVALFRWAAVARTTYPALDLMFAIPNGGKRDAITGAVMKREGVKKGTPDLMLPVPRGEYHGLFIELKRVKGGVLTKEQQAFLMALTAKGYKADVCRGWEEAKKVIEEYLK